MILDIHGGPKTVYGPVFYHEMQHWAGKGYFVIFCNPTGSDGRGEFMDIRGKYGTVARPTKITVKFQDRTGKPVTMKIQGYLARIFCHEYDHLDGVLYVDIAKNVGEDRA